MSSNKTQITHLLQFLPPITLEEMEKVRLMNRIDTKFVTGIDNVYAILERCIGGYMVQSISEESNMPYFTTYYDTEDFDMFYQHQRGKKVRQKVRTRIYEGTNEIPFLEIKHKNNKGRTKKKRVRMEDGNSIDIYSDFLSNNSFYTSELLRPVISNHFYRITLVNNDLTERITIDTDIIFHNLVNGATSDISYLGIVEWKRDGQSCKSGLGQILRSLRIGESGFSKYCMGLAITDPTLRHNRLKPRLRMLDKLSNRIS